MSVITIEQLAKSPQINSRRIARDLLEWLATKGYAIVVVEPVPGRVAPRGDDFYGITGTRTQPLQDTDR